MKWFERQLELSKTTEKPLFLHLREYSGEINEETADLKATEDFLNIVSRNKESVVSGGVVHSFTGSLDELNRILNETSFYIGINGCSLKTKENLEVVKEVPLDRIMIETDCPWCEIKATHAGYAMIKTTFPTKKDPKKWAEGHCVKNRSEPCHIVQVAEVIAKVKDVDVDIVADHAFENSKKLFKF